MHPVVPLRLAIYEDSRGYRESLQQLFQYTPNVAVVGAHPDCAHLRSAVLEEKPDVILMDIDMPGMNGIDATEIVKEISPKTQVIMLTVSEEEARIFKALQNGATGYLLKKTSPEELVESVHSVFKGGSPMSPAIARKVLHFFHTIPIAATKNTSARPIDNTTLRPIHTTETRHPTHEGQTSSDLSPREQEILEGLVDGLSYKLIAAKFFISPDTVKNHIQGIYRKLHVNSKGEAISMAFRQGLVRE